MNVERVEAVDGIEVLNALEEVGDYLAALYLMAESVESPAQRCAWKAVISQAESVLDGAQVKLGKK